MFVGCTFIVALLLVIALLLSAAMDLGRTEAEKALLIVAAGVPAAGIIYIAVDMWGML